MKLSLAIIVVSALLLSAESPSTKPSPSVVRKPSEGANLVKQPAQNYPSPVTITDTPKTPEQTPTPSDGGSGGQGDSGLMIFFTAVLAVATVGIMIFNYQLVGVTNEMHQVTKLALKIDRPYLVLERAQLTGVLRGDDPIFKEPPQLDQLTIPPRFSPRVVLEFRNYGKGPVIFGEGLIRIDAFAELPPARDFSGCERMGLQANAVPAGGEWHPLAQFNFEADWGALFPDIAAGRKSLIAYGCVRYTDPVGKDTYETGFCWIFIPPRTELHTMPKGVRELLAPYRAPGAPDPEAPIATKMPGDFRRGPQTHNYCD